MNKGIIIIITVLFALHACKITKVESIKTFGNQAKTTTIEQLKSVPDWAKSAVMYEVNVRQYSDEGTFKAVENDLPRLKALGVDILWLMPIHPIGEKEKKGSLGSYYSVKDYKKVNPEFGTIEDLKALVDATHQQGMYLIIDWVPNHSAWDNWLVEQHSDWYTKVNGKMIPPIPDWSDVVDFNYEAKGLRNYMIEAMTYWVETTDIDGFRCDVASEVPNDFWYDLKQNLDKVKPLFMLAEADKPKLHQNGFHATYAWDLHHILNEVAQQKMTAKDISAYLMKNQNNYKAEDYRLNFTSNHDENTWNGTVFERMGDAHKCLAALTYIIPGMPLIYNGQEAPLKKRLEFFEKDAIDWNNYEYSDFYKKLNALKKKNTALWNGTAGGQLKIITTTNNQQVLAISRSTTDNQVTAIFNLSDTIAKVEIKDISITKKANTNRFELQGWEYSIF